MNQHIRREEILREVGKFKILVFGHGPILEIVSLLVSKLQYFLTVQCSSQIKGYRDWCLQKKK